MRGLKRMRGVLAAGLIGLALSLPAGADTMADALAAAYRNSNLLEQNRALLRATDEDVQQSIAALGPVVEFVAQALHNTGDSPTYQISFGLNASIPLIDFGRGRLAVDANREAVQATRAALVSVEQSVLAAAVRAFLNLYTTLQTVELQRSNVAVIAEQQRAARERFELGDSTRTDVAIAEARLAASRSALAAAEGEAAVAREVYNLAVGRYPSQVSPPPSLPRLPATLAEAQDIARRNHPAISQAQHLVSVQEFASQIARLQRMGTLSGSLSADARVRRVAPFAESYGADITASMRYSVPVYNGDRLNSVERQALARAEAQRASLHQTVAVVQQSVAASWAQLQVTRARLSAADLQIAAAQSAYEAVRAETELGSRTTLDLLNAEQELLDARSARILAGAGLHTAAYALLESTGQLTVRALGLGIATYDVEAYSSTLRPEPRRETPSVQGQRLDAIMGRYARPEGSGP